MHGNGNGTNYFLYRYKTIPFHTKRRSIIQPSSIILHVSILIYHHTIVYLGELHADAEPEGGQVPIIPALTVIYLP